MRSRLTNPGRKFIRYFATVLEILSAYIYALIIDVFVLNLLENILLIEFIIGCKKHNEDCKNEKIGIGSNKKCKASARI